MALSLALKRGVGMVGMVVFLAGCTVGNTVILGARDNGGSFVARYQYRIEVTAPLNFGQIVSSNEQAVAPTGPTTQTSTGIHREFVVVSSSPRNVIIGAYTTPGTNYLWHAYIMVLPPGV